MKNITQLLAFFLCLLSFSQQSETALNATDVLNNYLEAINANELGDTSNIMTTYKGETAMGEMTYVTITSKDKIVEKLILAGTTLMHVVASNDGCYQVSNGEKKLLPETLCNDFQPFIGFFNESALTNAEGLNFSEIEENSENFNVVTLPGSSTTRKLIYNKDTDLKYKEIEIQKSGDNVSESIITYKDYEEHNGVMFPSIKIHSNFLSTGTDVEFKLESVQFNVPEVKE